MDEDLLTRMASALAEENGGEVASPGATRTRILATLEAEGRKRRLKLVWGAPLLAAFIGSTAWASAGGGLASWLRGESAVSGDGVAKSERVASKASGERPGKRAPEPLAAEEPSAPEERAGPVEGAFDEPAVGSPVAFELPAPRRVTNPALAPSPPSPPSQVPALSSSEPPGNDTLSVYRGAHHAQFRSRDYGAALTGYARYLALEPGGTFAADARYNSAICLLRLGRSEEARRALLPFARGEVGGYRRADARALVEALEAKPSASPH